MSIPLDELRKVMNIMPWTNMKQSVQIQSLIYSIALIIFLQLRIN